MRRKDRLCQDDKFIDDIFARAETMFLAMHGGEFPYCLPVNFARAGNAIYIHSATTGRKLDLLRADGHVAFSVAIDVEIDRAKSTTYYKSVAGLGIAAIVENEAEKGRALDAIGARYAALCKRPALEKDIRRVAIIRIDIVELCGKRCLPPQVHVW